MNGIDPENWVRIFSSRQIYFVYDPFDPWSKLFSVSVSVYCHGDALIQNCFYKES